MITKTLKVDYKLKKACFDEGELIDEEGNTVDLMAELLKVFKEDCFDLTVTTSSKEEIEVKDFVK